MSAATARTAAAAAPAPTRLRRFLGRPLAAAIASGDDNFHLLRLLAASLVVFGHSWATAFNPAHDTDPIGQRTGLFTGTVAVDMFFWISGFLVTMSYARRQSAKDFMAARLLRIFPALIVCVLASTLVLGPLTTTLSGSDYFAAPATWDYLSHNLRLDDIRWTLPGVFAGNPKAGIVNGCLWTLPGEIRMYEFVLILGVLGFLRDATGFWCGLLLLAAVVSGWPDTAWLQLDEYREFAAFFAAGAACWFHRERIPVSTALLIALAALAVVFADSAAYPVLLRVAIGYATLWLAYGARLPKLDRIGDYSYGIYLYGFPMQQLVAAWFPALGPWTSLVLSLPLSLACAVVSWHGVEKPAQALRRFVRPVAAPAAAP